MSARQESPSNDTEAPVAEIPKLSKNAQKRLLRKQRHEATREEWKAKRREKKRLSRQRKSKLASSACKADIPHIQQPVSGEVIIDLAFDSLMNEKVNTLGVVALGSFFKGNWKSSLADLSLLLDQQENPSPIQDFHDGTEREPALKVRDLISRLPKVGR